MTKKEILSKFKKNNKVRRLYLANKAGFKTVEEYVFFLTGDIRPKKKKSSKKPTIHIVDIVDCSGSMAGKKIRAAIEGVELGIKDLKENKEDIKYTYTLCDFCYSSKINWQYEVDKLKDVYGISFKANGYTALYDAIGLTLNKLVKSVGKKDKVLVNIYTDGGENDSKKYNASSVKELINDLKSKGFTVSFIGTDIDVSNVINSLGVDKSNTMSYDGSARELEKTLASTRAARTVYSKSVVKGKDVSKGFYKTLNK